MVKKVWFHSAEIYFIAWSYRGEKGMIAGICCIAWLYSKGMVSPRGIIKCVKRITFLGTTPYHFLLPQCYQVPGNFHISAHTHQELLPVFFSHPQGMLL